LGIIFDETEATKFEETEMNQMTLGKFVRCVSMVAALTVAGQSVAFAQASMAGVVKDEGGLVRRQCK
jgi:hypothetical protein